MQGTRSRKPKLIDLNSIGRSSNSEESNSQVEEVFEEMDQNQNQENQNDNQREERKKYKEHYTPIGSDGFTKITMNLGDNVNFKIDISFLNALPSYHGLPHENPYTFLEELIGKCSLYHIPGVSQDVLKMRIFPETLRDRAREWYRNLCRKFESWNEIEECFMKKFYTPSRTNQVRQEIQGFKQGDYESFCDAWERFRSSARKCPHHRFSTWHLMNIFYNGLNENFRNRVDYSCGGAIMEKYDDEIEEIMEKIAETDSHRLSLNHNGRNVEPKRGGVIDVYGKEAEIKIERNEHRIGKIETNIEKLTNLIEKFVTHTNVSKV